MTARPGENRGLIPTGESAMTFQERTREPQVEKKPRVALMNVIHDLPVPVARDGGCFKDEGLDIEFVATPGFIAETGGLLELHELQTWRPLHAAPQAYTRERDAQVEHVVPGATYKTQGRPRREAVIHYYSYS